MEEERSSKSKKTKLLASLIAILAGLGVILMTLSLLFGLGILGNREASLSSGESEEESTAETDISSVIIPISVDEAYEAYNSSRDYIFLDVRSEDEYNSGHIEGAVFIPVSELEGRLAELSKDKPVIAYCNGSSCSRSERAAEILGENGFSEVYNMAGKGIDEWVEKDYPVEISDIGDVASQDAEATLISVEEAYGIITSGEDYFILDVRNQDEYDEAHIEGAVPIPVSALESRLNELPGDRPIIVYCRTGGRSAAAASILVKNGFIEVYDMGGITEWIDKGYPTVSEE